ncbi:MAG: hypothetical protein IPP34_15355 [Bacteroidetes bacterium]|nr:hypothetical protein [Bacteroidota bacterium]
MKIRKAEFGFNIEGGAFILFYGKIYNPDNDPDLPKEPAYNGLMTMHEDCYGTLWFGGIGSQVVVVSDLLGSRLLHLDEAKLNQGVSGWTFCEPDSVSMWISTMDGKIVINKKTLKFTKQTFSTPSIQLHFLVKLVRLKGLF